MGEPSVTLQNAINVPRWDGQPRQAGRLWSLHKGTRAAECLLWTNPLGAEIRVEVGGEFLRSEAGADPLALIEKADGWKAQFIEKGWTA